MDKIRHAKGDFGLTLSGSNGVLYSRKSKKESKAGSLSIVGKVDKVAFNTPTNDGLHALFTITYDGVKQDYFCHNCLANSPSDKFGRLYLDGDMNGSNTLKGASNCKKSCEFVREGNVLNKTYFMPSAFFCDFY